MSVLTAREILFHEPGESVLRYIDFTYVMPSAETLTGTPTVAAQEGSGLTLGSPVVNTATITELETGRVIAIGKAVQVRMSDGVSGTDYILEVSCATASPYSNTRKRNVVLRCREQ